MSKKNLITAFGGGVLIGVIASAPAKATVIDFENGFSDLQTVNEIVTSDGNKVSFSVGQNQFSRGPAAIAEVGEPATAFAPNDGAGTNFQSQIGNYVLTDGAGSNNYYIEFERTVTNFKIDLLDYAETLSGGAFVNVTITAFSDFFNTIIDSIVVTNSTGAPGNSSLDSGSFGDLGNIRSVLIEGDVIDTGTAVDNLHFKTEELQASVPEPASVLGLLVLGAVVLGAKVRCNGV